jgi:hypothetical protein
MGKKNLSMSKKVKKTRKKCKKTRKKGEKSAKKTRNFDPFFWKFAQKRPLPPSV